MIIVLLSHCPPGVNLRVKLGRYPWLLSLVHRGNLYGKESLNCEINSYSAGIVKVPYKLEEPAMQPNPLFIVLDADHPTAYDFGEQYSASVCIFSLVRPRS